MDTMLNSTFLNMTFLSLTFKTWLFVLAAVFLSIVTSYIAARLLNAFCLSSLSLIQFHDLNKLSKRVFVLPFNIMLFGWIFISISSFFNLFLADFTVVFQLAKIISYVGFVLLGWRFTDLLQYHLSVKTQQTESKFDDLLVPLITRVLKVIVFMIGVLSVAELLKLPLASLVAGLGIGGLAIAMAAKDTIANIFGSVTVVSDRPFNIGDWVKIGNHEGVIEHLGFRSTRIRTFYDSLVVLPNSILLTSVVDNLGQRQFRRYSTKLDVIYSTSVQDINLFCDGIRQLILDKPYTKKEGFYVYLNDLSHSSVQILLYCFFQVPNWEEELKARHDLLHDILVLADKLGVNFAFPTQTLHIDSIQSLPNNSK